jgi:hypothetical protein
MWPLDGFEFETPALGDEMGAMFVKIITKGRIKQIDKESF